jgi:hypothetical protein
MAEGSAAAERDKRNEGTSETIQPVMQGYAAEGFLTLRLAN